MKSRWLIVSAGIVAACLTLAGAATATSSPAPAAPAARVEAQLQPELAVDPYLNASTIFTQAPTERKSCQVFASDCVFDGGPCGPVPNTCHCQFRPTGWICAR